MTSWQSVRGALQLHGADGSRHSYAARPAWGILGVLAGTLAAVLLVPEGEYQPPGEVALSAAAMSVGLLVGLAASAARSLKSAFRAEHLIMAGLIYWILLDAIQGSYGLVGLPREAVVGIFVSIGCFAAAVWIGSALMEAFPAPRPRVQASTLNPGPWFMFWSAVLLFALGSIRYLAPCKYDVDCIVQTFFAGRRMAWMMQGGLGDWGSLVHAMRFCGYLVLPFAVALHHVEGRITIRGVIVGLLGIVFLLLMVREGGRKGVGAVGLATSLLWIALQARVRARELAMFVAATGMLLLVLQAMLVWRDVGIGRALVENRPLELTDRLGYIGVDRNFYYLGMVVAQVPDRVPHTAWQGIEHLVLLPIPRILWPGKPDRPFNLPELLGRSADKPWYTITNSSVGDLYVIGGSLAIFIGGFAYGVAARLGSRLLERLPTVQNRLLFALFGLVLFISLRALSEVVITGYVVLAAGAVMAVHNVALRSSKRSRDPAGRGELRHMR